MASLTAYFKTVDSPAKKGKEEKKAVEEAKPTAASRKRKSNSNADAQSNTAAAAAAASSSRNAEGAKEESSSSIVSDPAAKKAKLDSLEALVPASWRAALAAEFNKPYWPAIERFLREQDAKAVRVFPPREQIFRALDLCPLEKVKVVILGQDPYHNVGQAEGLCFSVPVGQKVPSSLQNIYKELKSDLGDAFTKPTHGNLTKWAQQGVLLLNTGLTVKAHEANSHKNVGWSHFTDAIIRAVATQRRGVVFLLWGNHAQQKARLVDAARHHVLKTVHPSGLSASRGFFGCKHFSKTNELLKKEGQEPIDWQV